jgi:hypothetical protein
VLIRVTGIPNPFTGAVELVGLAEDVPVVPELDPPVALELELLVAVGIKVLEAGS